MKNNILNTRANLLSNQYSSWLEWFLWIIKLDVEKVIVKH
jgi:hypothetical protein